MKSMRELEKSLRACVLGGSVVVLVLLWLSFTATPSMADPTPVPVGVILDLNSTLAIMVNNSLALAVEVYYSNHNNTATKINLLVRNVSQTDVITAAELASDLITTQKVHAILGPQKAEQARYIVKLGNESKVPVIWFPITGPSLLQPPSPSSIYSKQCLNCFQFHAIADTIKALGWQSVIPIYEETEYGSHLIPCLTNVFKDFGIRMANITAMDSSNSSDYGRINATLDRLNDMRSRVFLLHMSMDFGASFIWAAIRKEMMGEGYAWILTQELSSLANPLVVLNRPLYYSDGSISFFYDYVSLRGYMPGALGVRPMDLISKKITDTGLGIQKNFSDTFNSGLTMYGWWAYHTLEALAMALEKPGTKTDGSKLANEIWATNFTGDSGVHFDLRKGQLDQSELEVYNVIGTRERIIGYWSPKNGLAKNNIQGGDTSGDDKYKLKDPLWPGDTLDKPPKLRIGLPRTNSVPEFVSIDSKPRPDGFAINVFLKAVDVLPFPLNNYEFVPLPNGSQSNASMTYDDILCSQIKAEDLDAIIGDITIVGNRTECVDFTLSYLDSSVAMVVWVKGASASKGILWKPFKRSLWFILGGIFLGATIIIHILERNSTGEFRFSNPFLVYKIDIMEKLKSRAARWMVILTSFLFILVVQVYTANLTSILTQGKMREPSFKDENEIKSSNVDVGYRKGSWVRGLLIEQIGIEESRLKALTNHEEYNKALLNGRVGAIFDETPYLTLFLSQYKSHFMITGPIYKTGGFAFAFPKKSGFTSHFSTAILKVTQDVELYRVLMARSSLPTSIEDLQFDDQTDSETSPLSIANFGSLYHVLLFIVLVFLLGLFILNPSVIEWLRLNLCSESTSMSFFRLRHTNSPAELEL